MVDKGRRVNAAKSRACTPDVRQRAREGNEENGEGAVVDSGAGEERRRWHRHYEFRVFYPSPIFRLRSIYEYVTKSRGRLSWTWDLRRSRVRGAREQRGDCK